jgi:elongation factor P
MGSITTNEIKAGMKVEVDGQPFAIVSNEYVKPGKGQAFNRIKIKNLKSGRVVEKTYKSGDKLDEADVEEAWMRMLYKDHESASFMNDQTFDQIQIPLADLHEVEAWLVDDLLYNVVFFKGEPISVVPPTFIELTIVETAPGDRGNTASGRVLKAAKVQTGAEIQVPIFIEEGEKIKVDTRTGDYVSRSSE